MTDHLRLEAEVGGYEAAAAKVDEIEATYCSLAALVGGARDQVALFDNSTRAWNGAFYSVVLRPGDRIVTTRTEYTSNIAAMWHRARTVGCEVVVIPDLASGDPDIDALDDVLDERVVVVAVTWMPTGSGSISPVADIGARVRRSEALFLVDATQVVGQLDVDVARIGCDVLTGTGRKFLRGPRGTGFSWIGPRALERLDPHVVDTASTRWDGDIGFDWAPGARRFETWEMSFANVLGLGAAVDQALAIGMPAIETRVLALARELRAGLASLSGVRVHDRGTSLGAIVTATVDDMPATAVASALRGIGISVSTTEPGQNQLDIRAGAEHPRVRFSPHYYNTESEIRRTVDAVAGIASRGRVNAPSILRRPE